MTAIEIKSELHLLIDSIEDTAILKAIGLLLKKQAKHIETDIWDELPVQMQKSVERGLAQSEKGEFINHEDVMNEVKKRYGI